MSNEMVGPSRWSEPAAARVQEIEDLWNTRDPARVVLAYALDSIWLDRTERLWGWEEIRDFLRREWAAKLGFRVRKELWAAERNRTAVYVEAEWHNEREQWYQSQGVEFWEFDGNGLIARRLKSAHEKAIQKSHRRLL
jgi:nuclear transport factor 2 (NTF2) superfamily protein